MLKFATMACWLFTSGQCRRESVLILEAPSSLDMVARNCQDALMQSLMA